MRVVVCLIPTCLASGPRKSIWTGTDIWGHAESSIGTSRPTEGPLAVLASIAFAAFTRGCLTVMKTVAVNVIVVLTSTTIGAPAAVFFVSQKSIKDEGMNRQARVTMALGIRRCPIVGNMGYQIGSLLLTFRMIGRFFH